MKKRLLFCLLLLCAVPYTYAQEMQLHVKKIAPHVWVHTSYKILGEVKFPSNGLIIATADGVVLVDTAWGEEQTKQLVQWVDDSLKLPIRQCLVTHAHDDRMGGIAVLQQHRVPVLSSPLTAQRAAQQQLGNPTPALPADTTIRIGGQQVQVYFPGAGHAPDNVVVYLPRQKVLFGGCLVKDAAAKSLGNTADATMSNWAHAVARVQAKYKQAKKVVPGHGPWGGKEALTHTIDLLQQQQP
ncbi:subclass B1 metallo-beta-lactamase [Pontibacter liquoris]|uniref:subclass B1 metallo-beta-lactamase n=1 Tax=Pontibacter liquoris TaxID=2905677 RepID=UPI001FA752CF|nr:subclass B1 metallo-beta-lactamase [Pontibacter liquoris]